MKFLFTLTLVCVACLVLVKADDEKKEEVPADKNDQEGTTELEEPQEPEDPEKPEERKEVPCDVELLMSADQIARLKEELKEYKSQKKAMKIIMKQVLDLIWEHMFSEDSQINKPEPNPKRKKRSIEF